MYKERNGTHFYVFVERNGFLGTERISWNGTDLLMEWNGLDRNGTDLHGIDQMYLKYSALI